MKVKIKHYFDFGNRANKIGRDINEGEGWNHVYLNNDPNNSFHIPENRSDWTEKCMRRAESKQCAEDIIRWMGETVNSIVSYGVGGAYLEYWIKALRPETKLKCSDYVQDSIRRLKSVFLEADQIECFDLINDPILNNQVNGEDVVLLHRIDTAFDDSEWKIVFQKFNDAGIRTILFIPCEFLSFRRLVTQKVKYVMSLFNQRLVFSGYLRTKDSLEGLFEGSYRLKEIISVGAMKGLVLKIAR